LLERHQALDREGGETEGKEERRYRRRNRKGRGRKAPKKKTKKSWCGGVRGKDATMGGILPSKEAMKTRKEGVI